MPTSDDTASAPALLRIEGPIATITLNRPAAFNSINLSIAQKLEQLGSEVEGNDDIRVLVIEGEGRAFSAGGDLQTIGAAAANDTIAPVVGELLKHYHAFIETVRRMPKIVLSSVHGSAAGAGMGLAFVTDLCIAADEPAGGDRRHQVAGLSGRGDIDQAATRCRGSEDHRRHAHRRLPRRGEEVHQQVEIAARRCGPGNCHHPRRDDPVRRALSIEIKEYWMPRLRGA